MFSAIQNEVDKINNPRDEDIEDNELGLEQEYARLERIKTDLENLDTNSENDYLTDDDFNKYVIFVDTLRKEEKIIKSEEINYDDAPQEFYDGLTFNIMTDPVKLPKSNVILDRKTIETHLLSDQTDPFNREPLTKDMLIPCPELKKRIEEYIINKKKEKNKNKDVNEIIE